MISLLEGVVSLVSIICILSVLKNIKVFCSMLPIYLVYNFTMVLPIMLETFLGVPNRGYYGLRISLNDKFTTVVYCIFVLITEIVLYTETKRQMRKKANDLLIDKYRDWSTKCTQQMNIFGNKQHFVETVSLLGIFAFVIGILLAPDASIYFKQLGAFSMFVSDRAPEEVQYHDFVMHSLTYLCSACVIINKVMDKDGKFSGSLIRAIAIILVLFVNGKRTIVMMLVGVIVLVDLIRNPGKKKTRCKFVFASVFLALLFIGYAYITGKFYYNTNWYATINEYLFRAEATRAAIFSINNPDKLKILDYPGQSILYNLFYYIPRAIWVNKPNPYPIYYFSAINGYSSLVIADWRFQTSIWAEFVSNFGYLGMVLVNIFLVWISRFLNKRRFVCKLLGIGQICILQLYEYSDLQKVIAILVLVLFISEKIKLKNHSVVLYMRK